MEAIIINKLSNTNNSLADALISIVTKTLPAVEDSFYESTVYGSKEDYIRNVFQVNQAFMNNFGKQLVETPLTYVRGSVGPVWSATPGQGIATGVVLYHYVTKQPLLLVVIDKSSNTYKYESAKYNAETNTFDTLTSKTKAAKSIEELAKFTSDNVAKDIATFITK